jgi:purine nucleoside phosphorylase
MMTTGEESRSMSAATTNGRRQAVAVILGSAFGIETLGELEPVEVATPHGPAVLHRTVGGGRPAYVLFRHGLPHRWLPNQIPYRAHAAALAEVGCGALLVTSSVGILHPELPLNVPLVVGDLLTLDNRLPDGSACTMFPAVAPGHGHLVLSEGLLSPALRGQVRRLAAELGIEVWPREVVFGYAGGPRSKTRAENRMWAALGADVNSMTLAPEVILANELEIPAAAFVIGHKYSLPSGDAPDRRGVDRSLVESRAAQRELVRAFLRSGEPVAFGNHLYRYRESVG